MALIRLTLKSTDTGFGWVHIILDWLSTSAKSVVLKKVDAIWQTNLGSFLPCLTGLNIHRRCRYILQHCVINNRIDFLSVSRLPRNNLTF